MIKIRSSNKKIKALLSDLIGTIEHAGGYINPRLELKLVGSDLGFVCRKKLSRGEQLILLPESCMPALNDFDYIFESGILEASPKSSGSASDLHREIVNLSNTLYNKLDKINGHAHVAVPVQFADKPELLNTLLPAASSSHYAPEKFASIAHQKVACFLNTRAFYDSRSERERLIPIIEFFDHNPFAGGFLYEESEQVGRSVAVNYVPTGAKSDIFITYSVIDALEAFVKFGFVDKAAFFVHSQPFDIELPGLGVCQVCRCDVAPHKLRHAEWLSEPKYHTSLVYNAILQKCENRYEMAYCLIPSKAHIPAFDEALKHNFRRFERMAGLAAGTLNNTEILRHFKSRLTLENKFFYKNLNTLASQSLSGRENEPVVKMLFSAIKQQMRIILEFEKNI